MHYFGKRWDAPVCDPPAQQVPTPIGEHCGRCGETIEDGDQGHLMGGIAADGTAGTVALHRECEMAGVVGHMFGVCSCTGWDSSRAAAREVLARVDAWTSSREVAPPE